MVGAQQPLADDQVPLEQRDRLSGSACGAVGRGQVVPRGQRLGVVVA
jgi:hypothetical protein